MTSILVVEDERIVAYDIQSCLKDLGYTVSAIAASGEAAIQNSRTIRPDLVLMDIRLEGDMDGIAAAEVIQRELDIPVVYLTASSDRASVMRAKTTDPLGYILKPFDPGALYAAVEVAIHKHRIVKQLRESERWRSAILENITDGLIATDRDGHVEFTNPVAETLTGWTQHEALGRSIEEVFVTHQAWSGTCGRNPIREAIRTGIVVTRCHHAFLRARDGTELPIDHSAAPLRADDGEITGAVLVFHDITRLVSAEEAMREHNRQLLRLQMAGAEIAASLDLRQVVETVVRQTLDLLTAQACRVFEREQQSGELAPLSAECQEERSQRLGQVGPRQWPDDPPPARVPAECRPEQITVSLPTDAPQHLTARPQTILTLPMACRDHVVGVIQVIGENPFTEQQVSLAQTLANQAATAITNARLYEQLSQRVDELTTLGLINYAITSSLDFQESLDVITAHARRLLDAAAASVAFRDETDDSLWFAAAAGEASRFFQGKRMRAGQGITGWVIEHGEPVLSPDAAQDPRFFGGFDVQSGFATRSVLCVPLQTEGRTIGAIEVVNKENGSFDQNDLRLLSSLASSAAVAVQNAYLYRHATQEIGERKRAEAALEAERASLAQRVAERTAELRQANLELAEAARLKDRFISNVSHELRTPLSVITLLSGNLEVFHDRLGEAESRQMIADIREYARILNDLVSGVLEISRIDGQQIPLARGWVDLSGLAREEAEGQRPLAERRAQVLKVLENGPVRIWGDERHLRQVVRNLLNNAIKYTPDGGSITCECCPWNGDAGPKGDWPGVADLAPGQWAVLRVSDTGAGIDQDALPHIFERFYRVETQSDVPGVGLGLSIVKELVEMHHGRVAVASTLGHGSTFAVYLPVQSEELPDGFSENSPGR